MFAARTKLLGFRKLWTEGPVVPLAELEEGPFFAFCGIGNPGAFLLDLQGWNLSIVGKRAFADHHPYIDGEILEIAGRSARSGRSSAGNHGKDAQNMADVDAVEMPIYVAVIEAEFPLEQTFLDAIRQRLPAKQASE